MVNVVEVSAADDERLRDYVSLTDVSLRRRKEPAEGLFIAESLTVVRRALAAGYQPRSALMSQRWLDQSLPLLADQEIDVYVLPEDVLTELTGFAVHRGLLAAMNRRPLAQVEDLIATARLVAVLEDLVDHTNVGAIFRSAAALGVDAVLISPQCADPLYRRSVRVSMGTVFQVPWTRAPRWPDTLDVLADSGFRTLALSPDPAGTALDDIPVGGRLAVVIGSEGPGLSEAATERCTGRVRIPMSGGVDSLNAGAASAVAFYALSGPAGPDLAGLPS